MENYSIPDTFVNNFAFTIIIIIIVVVVIIVVFAGLFKLVRLTLHSNIYFKAVLQKSVELKLSY